MTQRRAGAPLQLALSAWPGFSAWLALVPEVGTPTQRLFALLKPPPLGLRYGFLWVVPLIALALWWRRKNLNAAWNKVLGSPKELHDLKVEEKSQFNARVRSVERLRLWLIVAVLFLGEAVALAFAHGKDPHLVERLVWPWILRWL